MKQIPLTQGKFALVDDEDYDYLMQWKWNTEKARKGRRYYAKRAEYDKETQTQKTIRLHRVIMNVIDPNIHIDHKDHDGLNCQKNNMRIATNEQNTRNRRANKNSTSKYKGVSRSVWPSGTHKWKAKITINGKQINIGFFDEEIEAAKAYDKMAIELHGDFANPNFNFPTRDDLTEVNL